MTTLRFVNPPSVSGPFGPYSHAVEVPAGATWLHLAGQVSVDEHGDVVGRGDLEAQIGQVFENIGRILTATGYAWEDVVATTTYLTRGVDLDAYRAFRAPVYERLFPSGEHPTSTLLVVEGLATVDFLLEIQAVAAR